MTNSTVAPSAEKPWWKSTRFWVNTGMSSAISIAAVLVDAIPKEAAASGVLASIINIFMLFMNNSRKITLTQ